MASKPCKLPGCPNQGYVAPNGFAHDYCSQAHADAHAKMPAPAPAPAPVAAYPVNYMPVNPAPAQPGKCFYPGCPHMGFSSNGQVFNYCSQAHMDYCVSNNIVGPQPGAYVPPAPIAAPVVAAQPGQCLFPGCFQPVFVSPSGQVSQYCSQKHRDMAKNLPNQPVAGGAAVAAPAPGTCQYPNCQKPVWVDPKTGVRSSFCGNAHRAAAAQLGIQPAAPVAAPAAAPAPNQNGTCNFPGCSKPVYVDTTGRPGAYCGMGHLNQAKAQGILVVNQAAPKAGKKSTCKLPGCMRPVYVDNSGKASDYCCNAHRLQAVQPNGPPITIDMKDVKLEKKIGQGAFGAVWKAKWNGKTVAVKTMVKSQSKNGGKNEIDIMHNLNHPHLIHLIALAKSKNADELNLLMEFMKGGSLDGFIQDKSNKYTWDDARQMAIEIAAGMNALHTHSPPIIHRDLKSLNVLVDEAGVLKVSDFGLGREIGGTMTVQAGTPFWMAPEVIRGEDDYGLASDVYSYAIILWEIAHRSFPYPNNKQGLNILVDIAIHGTRPDIANHIPKDWAKLMEACWAHKDSNRPSFATILQVLPKLTLPGSSNV